MKALFTFISVSLLAKHTTSSDRWGTFSSARTEHIWDTLDAFKLDEFRDIIEDAGHTIVEQTDYLSVEYLESVDIFFTSRLPPDEDGRGILNEGEQDTLREWVKFGGKLIVTSVDESYSNTYSSFTSPLGIATSGFHGRLRNVTATKTLGDSHRLTARVDELDIVIGSSFSAAPGLTVLYTYESLPVVVVKERIGSGRGSVLVIGSWQSIVDGMSYNNQRFLSNVVQWAQACGDGVVQRPEECDDGNSIDNDLCRNSCTFPRCGDGILDEGEQCDDGNNLSDDSCRVDCTIPVCGNGIIDVFSWGMEDCDDGEDNIPEDFCTPGCVGCNVAFCEGLCLGYYACDHINWCYYNYQNCSQPEPQTTETGFAGVCLCSAGIANNFCAVNSRKVYPGVCGCDELDTDTDLDGYADCVDDCPLDPTKQVADSGSCGTTDCGDCTVAHSLSGCSVEAVDTCVCSKDVFCCNGEWDDFCVSVASECGC